MSGSVNERLVGIVINYLSILIILFIFYLVKYSNIPRIYLLLEIIPLLFLIISFVKTFGRTGLWKLSHPYKKDLDEREIQVVFKAISLSYGFFVIVTLIIIYAFALFLNRPIDVVLAAALLYFAHTLPAAIIACREKQV